jgi:hypothetical protein
MNGETTRGRNATVWVILAVLAGLLLLLSWIFRFPWDYLQGP